MHLSSLVKLCPISLVVYLDVVLTSPTEQPARGKAISSLARLTSEWAPHVHSARVNIEHECTDARLLLPIGHGMSLFLST